MGLESKKNCKLSLMIGFAVIDHYFRACTIRKESIKGFRIALRCYCFKIIYRCLNAFIFCFFDGLFLDAQLNSAPNFIFQWC